MTKLAENLERLEEAIAQACRRAGRSRGEIELMAVSKTCPGGHDGRSWPRSASRSSARIGCRSLPPRLLNLTRCASAPQTPVRVQLIGHLQSNKAGRAAELFDAIDRSGGPPHAATQAAGAPADARSPRNASPFPSGPTRRRSGPPPRQPGPHGANLWKEELPLPAGPEAPGAVLAIRLGNQRKMIYIPRALEDTVRRWVETGQEVDGLLEAISQQCLETFLAKKKEALARKRKEKPP